MAYSEGKPNFLKYYRVIKQFMKIKFKLREDRLDILMFLYSEPYFDRQTVKDFESILVWDKKRWDGLLRDGWIRSFTNPKSATRTKLYCLSAKGNHVVEKFYSYLEGKEIPMSPDQNPAFKRNVSYTDKVYRKMIKNMNSKIYLNKRMKEKDEDYPNLDGFYD